MSDNAGKPAARPEGFEPPTLGFEGRSSDQLTPFGADRAFRTRPHFSTLLMVSNPTGAVGFGVGRAVLAPFRHRDLGALVSSGAVRRG
jgi:hypothetical protein